METFRPISNQDDGVEFEDDDEDPCDEDLD